jgi:hypothetical protein
VRDPLAVQDTRGSRCLGRTSPEPLASLGEMLADPVLGHVQMGEGRVVSSNQMTKACLYEPSPRSDLIVVREANQNRNAS